MRKREREKISWRGKGETASLITSADLKNTSPRERFMDQRVCGNPGINRWHNSISNCKGRGWGNVCAETRASRPKSLLFTHTQGRVHSTSARGAVETPHHTMNATRARLVHGLMTNAPAKGALGHDSMRRRIMTRWGQLKDGLWPEDDAHSEQEGGGGARYVVHVASPVAASPALLQREEACLQQQLMQRDRQTLIPLQSGSVEMVSLSGNDALRCLHSWLLLLLQQQQQHRGQTCIECLSFPLSSRRLQSSDVGAWDLSLAGQAGSATNSLARLHARILAFILAYIATVVSLLRAAASFRAAQRRRWLWFLFSFRFMSFIFYMDVSFWLWCVVSSNNGKMYNFCRWMSGKDFGTAEIERSSWVSLCMSAGWELKSFEAFLILCNTYFYIYFYIGYC